MPSPLMEFLNEYNVRNRYIAQLIDDNAIEDAKTSAKDHPSLINRLNNTLKESKFPYVVTIVYYSSVAHGSYEFAYSDVKGGVPDRVIGAADLEPCEMNLLVMAIQKVLGKPVCGLFTKPYEDALIHLASWVHVSDDVDLHRDIATMREQCHRGMEAYEIWERATDYGRNYVRKLAEVLNGNPIHF